MIDIRTQMYKKADPYSPEVINDFPEQPTKRQGQAVLADPQERLGFKRNRVYYNHTRYDRAVTENDAP